MQSRPGISCSRADLALLKLKEIPAQKKKNLTALFDELPIWNTFPAFWLQLKKTIQNSEQLGRQLRRG